MTDPNPVAPSAACAASGPFAGSAACVPSDPLPAADTQRASRRRLLAAAVAGALLPLAGAHAQPARPGGRTDALQLSFRGTPYLHRWSKNGQHEFTPADDADLASWRDMVTLNVHAAVRQGEQLAEVANGVLSNYELHGRILQARSLPRTPARPAEHLIVAVLGTPAFLEAAFARCLLHEGTGLVAVASHRVYGKAAGGSMSEWLRAHGPQVEQALMGWAPLPAVSALSRLPRSA